MNVKTGVAAIRTSPGTQQTKLSFTKDVFLSAIHLATSIHSPVLPFGDELKTSAKEQVEYMLRDDEEVPLVMADDEIKLEIRTGLSKIFSTFEKELSSILAVCDCTDKLTEIKIMQSISDLEWMCDILSRMDLMKDFVANWVNISSNVVDLVNDEKLDSVLWSLKTKLIELTSKVLDAVGYGNVILPASCRMQLLKTWIPYIRKMKPILDSMGEIDIGFPYKMDEDLCQSIEGAIVSLILALPSNNQAEIFVDWMNAEQVKYPDLSEAFELWCYRTKSAKRRLEEGLGLDRVGNSTVGL